MYYKRRILHKKKLEWVLKVGCGKKDQAQSRVASFHRLPGQNLKNPPKMLTNRMKKGRAKAKIGLQILLAIDQYQYSGISRMIFLGISS